MEKDYVRKAIMKDLMISPVESVASHYGLGVFVIASYEQVMRTDEKLGYTFTEYDMLDLYQSGLTFNEVGYLKGITKEGVRKSVYTANPNKEYIKMKHRRSRKRLKNIILRDRIRECEKENAIEKLGYSERYFNKLCKDLKEGEDGA